MKITGNKILITGGTDGIGKAMAYAFARLGNQVIVVGRDADKLNEMAVKENNFYTFQCDVSKMEDLELLSMFIEKHHRDLNILINNAGIQYNYHFNDEIHLINKIEQEVSVNFLAPLRLIALLLPILKSNANAAIVNVSSGLGLVPKRQAPVYCGTKAGLHIFSKSLRYQLEQIKVFEVIPPLVDTNMTKGRGSGKMSPEKLVKEFIQAFKRDKYEIAIGKVKLLKLINRIVPSIAERIMKNGK